MCFFLLLFCQLKGKCCSTSVWTTEEKFRSLLLTSHKSTLSFMAAFTRCGRDKENKERLGWYTLLCKWKWRRLFSTVPVYFILLYCEWQIHLSVSQVSVSLSVDCQRVGERPARPLGNIPTDGFEMLGKLVRTRGPRSGSAAVSKLHWHKMQFLYTKGYTLYRKKSL